MERRMLALIAAVLIAVAAGCSDREDAPDSPKVAQNLGLVYLKQKDFDRALDAFQRVVALEDTYPLANYYIGLIHEMRGDAETAARYYTRDVNGSMSPAMLRQNSFVSTCSRSRKSSFGATTRN